MYFENVEEQGRIEGIASGIEFISEEQGYSDYRHCIMKASVDFEEVLKEVAWDIITLNALELYEKSLSRSSCRVRHYRYSFSGGKRIVYYKVTKTDEEVAFFEIEKILTTYM